jgi:chemotaxis-related protein WspB
MRCLAFHLGTGRYALPLRDLVELLPLLPQRELPHAPAYISGIINYRGQTVPVLDLCQLALDRPCEVLVSTRLVVLRWQSAGRAPKLLALMVERATSEIDLDPSTLEPLPVRIEQAPYLKDLAASAAGMMQLVDVSRMLSEEVADLLYPDEEHQP